MGSSPTATAMSENSERVKRWRKNTKIRMVDAFGGKCCICNYDKCHSNLAFHHLDPSEKDFSFGAIRGSAVSWDRIVVELRKCVMLCHNCHGEVHDGMTQLPDTLTRFDESFAKYKLIERKQV